MIFLNIKHSSLLFQCIYVTFKKQMITEKQDLNTVNWLYLLLNINIDQALFWIQFKLIFLNHQTESKSNHFFWNELESNKIRNDIKKINQTESKSNHFSETNTNWDRFWKSDTESTRAWFKEATFNSVHGIAFQSRHRNEK